MDMLEKWISKEMGGFSVNDSLEGTNYIKKKNNQNIKCRLFRKT